MIGHNKKKYDSDSIYSDADRMMSQIQQLIDNNNHVAIDDASVHKGDQLTFTLPQIATGLIALITFVGAILGAWGTLNSQITSQKISTDLTLEQMRKDITDITITDKESQQKMDNITLHIQTSIKELTSRVVELDSSVNQMYNRTSPSK